MLYRIPASCKRPVPLAATIHIEAISRRRAMGGTPHLKRSVVVKTTAMNSAKRDRDQSPGGQKERWFRKDPWDRVRRRSPLASVQPGQEVDRQAALLEGQAMAKDQMMT